MDSETPLVVNLEVTVPHIILPILQSRTERQEAANTEQARASRDSTIQEQVQLLPLGFDQPSAGAQDTSERMTHAVKFRMFRLNIPWIGKPLLLQVLRRRKAEGDQNRREADKVQEAHQEMYVTDASAFSLEFHSRYEDVESTRVATLGFAQQMTLQAGLNRVVIYLDKEGIPGSYSIDGAES